MKTFKIKNAMLVLLAAIIIFEGLYFFYELGKKYRGYDKQKNTVKERKKNII